MELVALEDKECLTVVRACARALRTALPDAKVGYRESAMPTQWTFTFIDTSTSSPEKFLRLFGAHDYWMSVSVAFENVRGGWSAVHTTIGIYHGLAIGPKTLLVRGEWDLRQNSSSDQHAQPHWHVHTAGDGVSQPSANAAFIAPSTPALPMFNPGAAQTTPPAGASPVPTPITLQSLFSDDHLSHVHLAMAARWHETDGAHVEKDPDSTQLASWIGGCTRYTREQFAYMLRKAGLQVP